MSTDETDHMEQRGHVVERVIAEMSSIFFMRDFVFQKPTYTTGTAQREITDLLLVLDQNCIPISVKGSDGQAKDGDRLGRWLRKKVWQATKNAKTAIQRLDLVDISALNLWGEQVHFPTKSLRPLCGLALVECSQEPFRPISFDVQQPESTLPIHFLSINDFLNVVTWLGSIWDLFNYFRCRAQVANTFDGINQERPLLSYYTLRSHSDFSGFRLADKEKLAEAHQLHLLDNLANYAERDRLLSSVNAVIHQIHTRHPKWEAYFPPELKPYMEPIENRQAYLRMAAMLNDLPSSNKCWIGREIETIIGFAKSTGSGCFLFRRLNGNVVFVFAVFRDFDRTEKIRALNEFSMAAIVATGMETALAVGYDALDEEIGFEVILRKGPVDKTPRIHALASTLFGSTFQTFHANPFGEANPYDPQASSGSLAQP